MLDRSVKLNVDLEVWLGDMSPSEFKTEKEIAKYFEMKNLKKMFPGDEIDEDEADEAYHACVRAWYKAKTA